MEAARLAAVEARTAAAVQDTIASSIYQSTHRLQGFCAHVRCFDMLEAVLRSVRALERAEAPHVGPDNGPRPSKFGMLTISIKSLCTSFPGLYVRFPVEMSRFTINHISNTARAIDAELANRTNRMSATRLDYFYFDCLSQPFSAVRQAVTEGVELPPEYFRMLVVIAQLHREVAHQRLETRAGRAAGPVDGDRVRAMLRGVVEDLPKGCPFRTELMRVTGLSRFAPS